MDQNNAIPERIASTLRQFPPFSMLSVNETQELAGNARVIVMGQGETIWKQTEMPPIYAYFLVRGRVEYIWCFLESYLFV